MAPGEKMIDSNCRKIILFSPHSVSECQKRIKEATSLKITFNQKVVMDSFRSSLVLRKLIFYKNSWQKEINLALKSVKDGTEILGTFDYDPIIKIIEKVWIIFLILAEFVAIGFTAWSVFVDKEPLNIITILVPVIPLAMLFIGFIVMCVGKSMASDEPNFLTEFLIDLLNSKIIKVEPEAAGDDIPPNSRTPEL